MGRSRHDITPQGAIAAKQLGQLLGDEAYRKYYCSPLPRALSTMRCIFPSAEINVAEDLAERSLGKWEGKSKAEIQAKFPEAFSSSGNLDPSFLPPGGESLLELLVRANRFLCSVSENIPDGPILIVSHNGVIRAMRALIELRPVREILSEPHLAPRKYRLDQERCGILSSGLALAVRASEVKSRGTQ